jgi:hypothetical protein
MGKYIVLAPVQGLNKRIFDHGETVTDAHFPPGNAEMLVKKRFLKPIEEEQQIPQAPQPPQPGANSTGELSKDVTPMTKAIEKIAAMESAQAIDAFIAGDERKGVKIAAEERKAELSA